MGPGDGNEDPVSGRRERGRKKDQTLYSCRDGRSPHERSHRSCSRNRFLSWRKKLPKKSKSFDQTEILQDEHNGGREENKKLEASASDRKLYQSGSRNFEFSKNQMLRAKVDIHDRWSRREEILSQILPSVTGRQKDTGSHSQNAKQNVWVSASKSQHTPWPKSSIDFDPSEYGHLDDGGVWTGEERAGSNQPPDLTSQTHWRSPSKLKKRKINVDLLETLAGNNKSGSSSPSTTPTSTSLLSAAVEADCKQPSNDHCAERRSSNSSEGKNSTLASKFQPSITGGSPSDENMPKNIVNFSHDISTNRDEVGIDGTPIEILEAKLHIQTTALNSLDYDRDSIISKMSPAAGSENFVKKVPSQMRSTFKKRGISVPDYGRGMEGPEPKTIIPIDSEVVQAKSSTMRPTERHPTPFSQLNRSSPRQIPHRDQTIYVYDWTISAGQPASTSSTKAGVQLVRGLDLSIGREKMEGPSASKEGSVPATTSTSGTEKSSVSSSVRSSEGNSTPSETFLPHLTASVSDEVFSFHPSISTSSPAADLVVPVNSTNIRELNPSLSGYQSSLPSEELGFQKLSENIPSSSWLRCTGGFLWDIVKETVTGKEDMEEEEEDDADEEATDEDDAFSVKRMKKNVDGFASIVQSALAWWSQVLVLVDWSRPLITSSVLTSFFFCVIYDWWLSGCLLLLFIKLTGNYLTVIRWRDRVADLKIWILESWNRLITYILLKIHHITAVIVTVLGRIWALRNLFRLKKNQTSLCAIEEETIDAEGENGALETSNLLTEQGSFKSKKLIKTEDPNKKGKKEKLEAMKKNSGIKEKEMKFSTKDQKEGKEGKRPSAKAEGLGDKIVFLLQIAKRTQNFLGAVVALTDVVSRLVQWQHRLSWLLHLSCALLLLLSLLLPSQLLLNAAVVVLVFRSAVIAPVVARFPRFKRRLLQRWKLRCDAGRHSDKLLQNALARPEWSFCYVFNLPLSESPRPGWSGGRRCTLVNRDRSLTSAFKSGRLYLTASFLCFERSRSIRAKNITLPLANVARVLKAESCSWIPGGGMAIEVCMKPDRSLLDDNGHSPPSSGGEEEAEVLNAAIAELTTGSPPMIASTSEAASGGAAQPSSDAGSDVEVKQPLEVETLAEVTNPTTDSGTQMVEDRKISKKKVKRKLYRRKTQTDPQSYFFGGIRNRDDAYEDIAQAVARVHQGR